MKLSHSITSLLSMAALFTACHPSPKDSFSAPVFIISQESPIHTGDTAFDKGVSAPFGGILSGMLVVGGGCNFPATPVYQGGQKVYYQTIYAKNAAEHSDWYPIARFPEPLAYGVSVAAGDALIFAGGNNEEGASRKVWKLTKSAEQFHLDTLPSLPFGMDNMAGTLSGDRLFLAGGNTGGRQSNVLISLSLTESATGWRHHTDFPGNPRIQPVLNGFDHENEAYLLLSGGFSFATDSVPAEVNSSTALFHIANERWTPGTDAVIGPDTVALGGGTSVTWDSEWILFAGGVNRRIFSDALNRNRDRSRFLSRNEQAKVDSIDSFSAHYLKHSPQWYRFNTGLVGYRISDSSWHHLAFDENLARAGALLIRHGEEIYLVNGELKPGVRTPLIVKVAGKSEF